MRLFKTLFLAFVPVSLALPATAHADCAEGVGYNDTVTGNTVQIQSFGIAPRACPDTGGMVRQDVHSGAIVKLADYCVGGDYVDECVPPGTYRYGFADPYACQSAGCGGTPYYVEVTVADSLSGSCTRNAADPGPTPATAVPWKDSSLVCAGYQGSGGSGTTGSSGSASSSGGAGSPGKGGGCAVSAPPAALPVLGANALALVAGVALMRRRRGQRS
jgi:hypothetical protein